MPQGQRVGLHPVKSLRSRGVKPRGGHAALRGAGVTAYAK